MYFSFYDNMRHYKFLDLFSLDLPESNVNTKNKSTHYAIYTCTDEYWEKKGERNKDNYACIGLQTKTI